MTIPWIKTQHPTVLGVNPPRSSDSCKSRRTQKLKLRPWNTDPWKTIFLLSFWVLVNFQGWTMFNFQGRQVRKFIWVKRLPNPPNPGGCFGWKSRVGGKCCKVISVISKGVISAWCHFFRVLGQFRIHYTKFPPRDSKCESDGTYIGFFEACAMRWCVFQCKPASVSLCSW